MSREVLDYYQREKLRIQLKIADVRKKSDGGYDAYLAALTDALQQVDRVIKKHRQKHVVRERVGLSSTSPIKNDEAAE